MKRGFYRSLVPVLVLVFCGLALAFDYYHRRTTLPKNIGLDNPIRRSSKYRLKVKGFQFEGFYGGKKTLRIRADSFTIERMKMGHFRLAFLNVARLQNGEIDIFGQPRSFAKESALKDSGSDVKSLRRGNNESRKVVFKHVFEKESLPSFGVKHISSIKIEPVTVSLYANANKKMPDCRISAASGSIRLKNRDILFKGGVRVSSDDKTLLTEELSLAPESAEIMTTGVFELKAGNQTIKGKGLKGDIFLRGLRPVVHKFRHHSPASGIGP